MLVLERGNPDNLEGRVYIYSNLVTPPNSHVNIAYGAVEKDEVLAKIAELGDLPGIEQTLGEIIDDIMKGLPQSNAFHTVPFYFINYELNPGEKFDKPEGHDIIFAGKFGNTQPCELAMKGAALLYTGKFAEQMMQRQHAGKDSALSERLPRIDARLTPNIRYTEFNGETLPDYILQTYVVPMLDAVRLDQPNIYDRLRQEFTQFSFSAPFMADVQQISILVKERKPNLNLIQAYVRKIGLIQAQNYEGAAVVRDEIKQMGQAKR